jgi:phosphoenolpyruvate phosphomutase
MRRIEPTQDCRKVTSECLTNTPPGQIREAGGTKHFVNRFTALRELVASSELSFLMEAHSGVSAKIAEEAGFSGLWASGLTISAALGLRDSNEASWTQILDVLEYMADATSLPILVDGDTVHGNFNNARRFVRKLCERGSQASALKISCFPKPTHLLARTSRLPI